MDFRKTTGKLPAGVKRGHEGMHPIARDSSHSVTSDGAHVRHHVALEYRADGPSKRVRINLPSPSPVPNPGIPFEEEADLPTDHTITASDSTAAQPPAAEDPVTPVVPEAPIADIQTESKKAQKKVCLGSQLSDVQPTFCTSHPLRLL